MVNVMPVMVNAVTAHWPPPEAFAWMRERECMWTFLCFFSFYDPMNVSALKSNGYGVIE
jgi:hypothetical protein